MTAITPQAMNYGGSHRNSTTTNYGGSHRNSNTVTATVVRVTATVIAFVFLGGVGCSTSTESELASPGVAGLDERFAHDTLVIEADDGKRHYFRVYLATRFEQQRRGLMFVRKLPDDVGMLFVYEDSAVHSMWMKNTYIPLDIVFATRDGAVATVIRDTTPLSLESLSSQVPVTYVLELKSGTTRRLNIGKNSKLIWTGADNQAL